MKTLKESILDIDDNIEDQSLVEFHNIKEWLNTHIPMWERWGGYIKDNKVYIECSKSGSSIDVQLGKEGVIPDFIKWGDVKNASFGFRRNEVIKSFKNFPTTFDRMQFSNDFKNMPNDFSTWGGKIICDSLLINSIKSLKGLEGEIDYMFISNCDDMIEFNCPKLTVNRLICNWVKEFKLKTFDNLPNINKFDLKLDRSALRSADNSNIKKPNKITWNTIDAPYPLDIKLKF